MIPVLRTVSESAAQISTKQLAQTRGAPSEHEEYKESNLSKLALSCSKPDFDVCLQILKVLPSTLVVHEIK